MATITIKYDIQIGATVSIRVAAMAGGYWGSILFSFEATAMWEWSLGRGAAKQCWPQVSGGFWDIIGRVQWKITIFCSGMPMGQVANRFQTPLQ